MSLQVVGPYEGLVTARMRTNVRSLDKGHRGGERPRTIDTHKLNAQGEHNLIQTLIIPATHNKHTVRTPHVATFDVR